ncbi:unnamed protein product [Citrullus colocynthis]|uniref:Uncharacterized protein n=1 Tax=Citrullus colocynthis TaxID=252529 RepID=A0ABP0Y7S0_9ROSI
MVVVVEGDIEIVVMGVDLQLRSGIRTKTEDHGHQRRSDKRDGRREEEEEEEEEIEVEGAVTDLDRKRKERLNEQLDSLNLRCFSSQSNKTQSLGRPLLILLTQRTLPSPPASKPNYYLATMRTLAVSTHTLFSSSSSSPSSSSFSFPYSFGEILNL